MRALTVAPSVANAARVEGIPEPPLAAGAVQERSLALGVCATGWAPPDLTRLLIGHQSLGRVSKVGGVGAPGRAFSIDLGKHNEDAVAAFQQAGKGRLGRLIMRRVAAEQWTPAAPEPHDVKVVDVS
jgi:hypothetical protein